jgi:hypothetical protein
MKQALLEHAVDVYWAGVVRQLLKAQSEVLADAQPRGYSLKVEPDLVPSSSR